MGVPAELNLAETTGEIAPSTAGCSWTDGRATGTYYIYDPDIFDLAPVITSILGDTAIAQQAILGIVSAPVNVQSLRLARILPLAHPAFEFWYASAIRDIVGIGTYEKVKVDNAGGLEVPPISNFYALYPQYAYKVEFMPRPYPLLRDTRIKIVQGSWFPFNDTGSVINSPPLEFNYAEEWLRYTDVSIEPIDDSVTATHGEMIYRDVGTAGARYSGMPRMYLKNQLVTMRWDQIPYSYVTDPNSYLKKYRGYVNQNPFPPSLPATPGTFQTIWQPGELLYLGFKIARRYTPPVPKLVAFPEAVGDPNTGGNVFSTEKFVDVEMKFLETKRIPRNLANLYNPKPFNRNFVAWGHNLLPWAQDRDYHYCASYKRDANPKVPQNSLDENFWYPSWLSFPCEILFSNPSVVNPNV